MGLLAVLLLPGGRGPISLELGASFTSSVASK